MATFLNTLSERVLTIRRDRYGDDVAELALAVGVPQRTWENYEAGVTMPAPIMLRFLDVTGANPRWVLTGKGTRYLGVCRRIFGEDGPRAAR